MDHQQNISRTPVSLRNFIRRLNNSSVRRKERFQQLDEISGRVRELSGAPLESFSMRDIPVQVKKVSLEMKKVADEEKIIGIRQKNEENEVSEMKRRIEELANRVESVGHLASMTSQEQFRRLEEMHREFLEMNPSKVAEQPEVQEFIMKKMKPLEDTEAAVRKAYGLTHEEKPSETPKIQKPMVHPAIIKSIEKQISDAEKLHKRLVKAGHPPERLEIIKDKIDMHRRKLKELKAVNSGR